MALTYIYNPFTGNLDAIDSATGSPNTVAGFDGSGNIQSIPLWNVNTATGGLYQNLFISDSVNPGSPITSVINNFQTTTTPSAPVSNLGYLNLQNHGWIAGDDILGYMGFSNTIDGGGTGDRGDVVGLRNGATMGTSVEASNISSMTMLWNALTIKDLQTVTNNVELFNSSMVMESGAVVSNSVLGFRNSLQVDAGASTGDIALFDMYIAYDGTLTAGNIRMGSMIGNVSSALPGGSGLSGFNMGYNLSNTSQYVNGMIVGHTLQSGSSVTNGTFGFSENIQIPTGGAAGNVVAFSSGTNLQSGGSMPGGYTGFQAAPTLAGTMTGVGANPFISTAQISTAMDHYTGFMDQSNFLSGASTANTLYSFSSNASIQSGATVNDLTAVGLFPSAASGSTVTTMAGLRFNPSINTSLSDLSFIDLQTSGSPTATNAYGVRINMTGITSSNQKIGLKLEDGKIESDSNYLTDVLPASPGFASLNQISGLFHVKPSNPTSSTLVLGAAVGTNAIFEDDMGPDAFGGFIGFAGLASVNQVAVAVTKTVDTYTALGAGASVPDLSGQGITGGGTITNANVLTVAGILNAGASVAITNLKGVNIPSFFNGFSATNAWGVYVADSTVDNWFAKDVVIGGSTGKPIGSEALTVNGSMAMAGATSGEVTLSAAPVTTSYSLVMPNAQGAASTVLTNDGSGNLSWAAGGGGPTYTAFAFANNQSTPANVTGFSVNSATNHGFVADMSILRIMSGVSPVGNLNADFQANIGTGPSTSVSSIAADTNGDTYLGGPFTSFNGNSTSNIVKVDSQGVEIAAFTTNVGTGFNDEVKSIGINSLGQAVMGGKFTSFNGNTRRKLIQLNSDGTEDSTFITNLGNKFPLGGTQSVQSVAVQSDDAIVVGGNFSTYNGGSPSRLVRINSDGTDDSTFNSNVGTGLNAVANSVIILASGKILVGGDFTTLNGSSVAAKLIRLNSDGTLDTTFDTNLGTGFNSAIYGLYERSDNSIVVVGGFTSFNGNTRNRMVLLNSDGTEDTGFYTNLGTAFNGTVLALTVQPDDKILAGGSFTDFNGNGLNYIVRLNSDGTEDTAFTTLAGSGPDSLVDAFDVKPSGAVLMGGAFTTYGGASYTYIAEFEVIPELDQTFTFYGTYSNDKAKWKISDPIGAFDDAGVELSITAGGQLQYTSSNLLGTSVTQSMRWMIRGL
jgi:uncharacterized delta-60 repeat protein